MSGEKREPAAMVAATRRAWSPDGSDAARVRRALAAAVVAGATPAATTARTPRWTTRVLAAGAIAAASGGAGYWAGHRAGLRDARPMAPTAAPAPAVVAAAAPSPAVAAPATAPSPPASPHRDATRSGARAASKPAPSPGASLAIEVQALRNAERALRDGQPGLALAFLQELDRQVPHGQLTEERDAAATLAHCARGDRPFGVDLGADFAQRHPTSVYRARVDQACAQTDSEATGDSARRRSRP